MQQKEEDRVNKRRVFYIPGYDPIHPRRYRELYRSEGKKQAEVSGYELNLRARATGQTYGWLASTVTLGSVSNAEVDVLVWSDIVRKSISNSISATYWQLIRTAWIYITSGALRRLMWLRKGPIIAALYPIGMLLLQLVVAIVLGAIAGGVVAFAAKGLADMMEVSASGAVFALRLLALVVVAITVLRFFKRWDKKLFAYYLMHDFAFSARWRGANAPDLEERLEHFGDQIAEALSDDVEEVLIVGHSSGAHLGVSIIADLIRAGRVPKIGPKLAFLTLGHVVPMVSFLPGAHRLRADLAFLANRPELFWLDVSAPGDGCSFALCDPVAVSGVAPVEQKWPLVISAAFTQSLKPATWRRLRWRFFRLHFQYLCAFDAPLDYDYFQITAGPISLASRYRDRKPAKSRIDVAASGYRSVSA